MSKSNELFKEAVKYIPGGVNSPVRAFGSIGTDPIFIKKADGPFVYDADDKKYIDLICSWGPMILGHNDKRIFDAVVKACENGLSYGAATEIEVEVAKFICKNIPWVQMIRMVNSGTEAVMSAIRAARGYTKRNKIIKFMGCYHGHSDALLVKAGSGVMTNGGSNSDGVTTGCIEDTLCAEYNNLESVERLFEKYAKDIACIIVEPVGANMGVVLPEKGFLEGLRKLCDDNGALLIFDEVITGFRLKFGGAAELFGIKPDLVTYGKIIGAGMPVGAYGGRREVMEVVAPVGNVYQAGTLSGNPIAMTAGLTQLKILKENPEIYTELANKGDKLYGGIKEILARKNKKYTVNNIGSLGCVFFTENEVRDYESAKLSDTNAFAVYCKAMFEKGVYLAPSQFEAMFLSLAHTENEINDILNAIEATIN